MKLQLDQSEIEKALEMYIGSRISMVNQKLTIDFTAGRKPGGLLADLTIEDSGTRTQVEQPADGPCQEISGHDTEVPSMADLGINEPEETVVAQDAAAPVETPKATPAVETANEPEVKSTSSLFDGS